MIHACRPTFTSHPTYCQLASCRPHRSRTRSLDRAEQRAVHQQPMATMTSITAMTWLISFNSRPIANNWPIPADVQQLAAISERRQTTTELHPGEGSPGAQKAK